MTETTMCLTCHWRPLCRRDRTQFHRGDRVAAVVWVVLDNRMSVFIWSSQSDDSYDRDDYVAMESQMVQNSRDKIGLTFNKIVIKVKTDFSQAQQNQFMFNRFSLKVKTFRIKLSKITSSLSRNYLSRARDI